MFMSAMIKILSSGERWNIKQQKSESHPCTIQSLQIIGLNIQLKINKVLVHWIEHLMV